MNDKKSKEPMVNEEELMEEITEDEEFLGQVNAGAGSGNKSGFGKVPRVPTNPIDPTVRGKI